MLRTTNSNPRRLFLSSAVYIYFSLLLCLRAQEPSDAGKRPQAVLKAAQVYLESLKSIQMEATTSFGKSGVSHVLISQKKREDGSIFLRCEVKSDLGRIKTNLTTITNREGTYQLFPKQMIAGNVQFLTRSTQAFTQDLMSSLGGTAVTQGGAFEMIEAMINGRDCYEITQTLSNKAQDAIKKALAGTGGKEAGPNSQGIPAPPSLNKIVYDVDRLGNYITSQKCYSEGGDLISSLTYDSVKPNAPLDDALFRVPAEYKKININTPKDMVAIMIKE